jgi:hypothetical protein
MIQKQLFLECRPARRESHQECVTLRRRNIRLIITLI